MKCVVVTVVMVVIVMLIVCAGDEMCLLVKQDYGGEAGGVVECDGSGKVVLGQAVVLWRVVLWVMSDGVG